jgi:putative endonuclease
MLGISNNPYRRVLEHNSKPFNTYTSKYRPWALIAVFECSHEEKEAMRIERFIKKQKSRELIKLMLSDIPLTGIQQQERLIPDLRDFFYVLYLHSSFGSFCTFTLWAYQFIIPALLKRWHCWRN